MSRRRLARLGIEPLEQRDLMALWDGIVVSNPLNQPREGGNITAEVIEGVLVVRGDEKPNGLQIVGQGDGTFLLSTINGWSTINGQETGPEFLLTCGYKLVTLTGVTAGIDIEMGAGDDYVSVIGRELPRISIDTGDGDDSIGFGGYADLSPCVVTATIKFPSAAGFKSDLVVDAGAGDDLVSPFAHVHGDATIRMGEGDDIVNEPESNTYGTVIAHRLVVDGVKVVDLGPGEVDLGPSVDWRTDAELLKKIHPQVQKAFERYAVAKTAGEVPASGEFILPLEPGEFTSNDPPLIFAEDGRLRIEFTFYHGERETIERLKARGLSIDALSVANGLAYATIREADFALFGNLRTIGTVAQRGLMYLGNPPFELTPPLRAFDVLDVNHDGFVRGSDALAIIDFLQVLRELGPYSHQVGEHPYDLNDDKMITAADALIVINAVNERMANEPSGTGETAAEGEPEGDWLALAAVDEVFAEVGEKRGRQQ